MTFDEEILEVTKRGLEAAKRQSPDEAKKFLQRAGIVDDDGALLDKFKHPSQNQVQKAS